MFVFFFVFLPSSEDDSEGIKRSAIVNWYLEQIAEQIESEEELIERKTLIEKVIDRLVNHVSCIQSISLPTEFMYFFFLVV
jgi:DNA replication licensing factor MCM6